MAYEMHEWVCNEPITADKLNHMENGIVEAQNDESSGGGVFVVRFDHEEEEGSQRRIYYDKTWQQLHDAVQSGQVAIFIEEDTENETISVHQLLTVEALKATFTSGSFLPIKLVSDEADAYLYQIPIN